MRDNRMNEIVKIWPRKRAVSMNTIKSIFLVFAFVPSAAMAIGSTNELAGALQRGLFEEEANHNFQAAIQSYQAAVDSFNQSRDLAATALFRLGEVYRKLGKTNEALAQYQRVVRDFSDQAELVSQSQKYLGSTETAGTNIPPKAVDLNADEIHRLQKLISETPDLINAGEPGNGRTPLHNAVRAGRLPIVEFLLTNGVNVNVTDIAGATPLMDAVQMKRTDIIAILLNAHAQPDVADKFGQSPLEIAAYLAFKPGLDLLLQAGANPNHQADGNVTPLHYAVAKGFKAGIEELIKYHANPNINAWGGRNVEINSYTVEILKANGTPLHSATALGFSAAAEALLAGGADVNAVNSSKATPLHIAVTFRQPAIAKLLLEKKANVNAQSEGGTTPLMQAAAKADLEFVKLLLSNHANPKLANNSQSTALHQIAGASAAIDSTNILNLLLDAGADPNATDNQGRTPLLSINFVNVNAPITPAQHEFISLLLKRGANPDAADNEGLTLLMIAARHADLGLTQLLLSHKADPNLRHHSQLTALHFLVSEASRFAGSAKVAAALLDAGAEVNAPGVAEATPLGWLLGLQGSSPRPIRRVGIPSLPGPAGTQGALTPEQEQLKEVLIAHGGLEQTPNFNLVKLTRENIDSIAYFTRDTNAFNHFTLYELLAQHYFIAWPAGAIGATFGPGGQSLSFPDLSSIRIHRPSRANLKEQQEIVINVLNDQDALDCSKDVRLEFGDRVEIPERAHSLADPPTGLTSAHANSLKACLERTVTFIIRGQRKEVKLSGTSTDSYLSVALRTPAIQGALRTTSNLSAVKVSRTDPMTHGQQEIVEDVLPFWQYQNPQNQKPITEDLWLRAGDTVEVPEKNSK